MEEIYNEIDLAISNLVNKNTDKLECNMQKILKISAKLFPAIVMSYMNEALADKAFEAPSWVHLFEDMTNIGSITDGFVLYDIIYNRLYKMLKAYESLLEERNIVIG